MHYIFRRTGKSRFLKTIFISLSFFSLSFHANAQLDTSFWFAAPEVTSEYFLDRPIVLRISTLADPSTVRVTMPANPSFAPLQLSINAFSSGTIDLTPWINIIESKPANTVLNNGLKITASAPVNVYYEVVSGNYGQACQCNPEVFSLKGKSALGTHFLIPSQNILSNWPYNPPSTHGLDIVATEDNTVVEILPTYALVGRPGGTAFTVTLNRGQVYSATAASNLSFNHLGGSVIKSDKKIAITLKDDGLQVSGCWDMGGDQIIPVDNLSNEYIAIRGYLQNGITDRVFITALYDNTPIYLGGTFFGNLKASQTVSVLLNDDALYLNSTKPFYAFQMSGSGCEVGLSTLPSLTCRGSTQASFTRSSSAQLTLLVLTRRGNQAFFDINGTPVNESEFRIVPNTGNLYYFARLTVPVSTVPALGSVRIRNSKGLFHVGLVHGDGPSGGARFAYFSDFGKAELNIFPDSLAICSNTLKLDGGSENSNFLWNTGATTQSITVSQNGLYKVTLDNYEGCRLSDSTFVRFEKTRRDTLNAELCRLDKLTLPSGKQIGIPGTYPDTLKSRNGCDSLITLARITQKAPIRVSVRKNICSGQTYLLPGGVNISQAGVYTDTLQTTNGCDSIITTTIRVSPPLSITLDGPGEAICAGTTVNISATASGGIPGSYAYKWTGFNGSGSSFSFTPTTSIQLIAELTDGCTVLPARDTLNITVVPKPTVRFTPDNRTACVPARIRFSNQSTAAQNSVWSWNFGTGVVADTSAAQNPEFTFTRTGKFPVKLRVFSASGCIDEYTDTITVLSRPVAAITGPSAVCVNQPITFTESGPNQPGDQWLWNFGNGSVGTQENPPSVRYSSAGQFTVTLIKQNAGGCSDTATVPITIHPAPIPGLNNAEQRICRGESVQLTATDGVQYAWSPSEGLSNSAIANPLANPVTDTRYTVTVTNRFGCSTRDSLWVRVSQPFSITASGSADICAGTTAQLQASGAVRYEWLPANGLNNPNTANPVASPAASTTYQVVGYDNDNCFTDTAFVPVNVLPLPQVNAGNDTLVVTGTQISLSPQYSNDAVSWTWTPSRFLSCSSCPAPVSTPLESITYTVTARNNLGCEASDDIRIQVSCSKDDLFFPNTFTPNGDGMNDVFYPRSRAALPVQFLRIYNRWGELVFEKTNVFANDINSGWNGLYKGKPVDSGAFVWIARVTCTDGKSFDLKGSIMLIR